MSLRLRFAGRGVGGADDARERASDDRVSFGVLRLCVGRGTFARWKSVLLHFNPESASVVARGRANAQKARGRGATSDARARATRRTREAATSERDGALTMRAKTLNRCISFAGTVIAVFDVDDV